MLPPAHGLLLDKLTTSEPVSDAAKYYVKNDETCTDSDSGVCHVERGVVIGAEPHFEEVGDCAMQNAVDYIPSGTAKQKRQAGGAHKGAALSRQQHPRDEHHDHERTHD